MASQNPSSVPVIIPDALSPVSNYINNNTALWPLKGDAGGPIFYNSVTLPAGPMSSVTLLDTSNLNLFPEGSSWYYNISFSPTDGQTTVGPDSAAGQCGASGVFVISGGNTLFQGGNAVSNLTAANTENPGRIQVQNGGGGTNVRVLTLSDASFTSGTFFISYSRLQV